VMNISSTTITISSFSFTANVPQGVGGPTVAFQTDNSGTSLPMQLAPGQTDDFQAGVWDLLFNTATSQVIWSWTDSAYSTCPSAPLEPTYP
jgi:hypothetical protein